MASKRKQQRAVEIEKFLGELVKTFTSTDDRSVAIMGVAGLDFLLENFLHETVVEELPDSAFTDANGPLSSFSSKIAVAYAFGIISTDEYKELNLLRKIRNDFAHSLSTGNFADSDRCMSLQLGVQLYMPPVSLKNLKAWEDAEDEAERNALLPDLNLDLPNADDPRTRFISSVTILGHILSGRAFSIERINPPTEATSVFDGVDLGLAKVESNTRRLKELRAELRKVLVRQEESSPGSARERLEALDADERDVVEIESQFAAWSSSSVFARAAFDKAIRLRTLHGLNT